MKKKTVFALALAPALALAQGKEGFVVQQAYAEMQRVQGQVNVMQSNLNDVQSRVAKLESGGDARGLRSEVDALRAEVSSLRRQLASQREEIVRDLSARLAKMQKASEKPERTERPRVYSGPHREYIVEKGDTLTLISQAMNVPIRTIREMNGLKGDGLRIGQKIVLPAE